MAQRDEILIGGESAVLADRPLRVRLAAFVPITIAVAGIGAVMLGGISARHQPAAQAHAVDTIATGSIAAE